MIYSSFFKVLVLGAFLVAFLFLDTSAQYIEVDPNHDLDDVPPEEIPDCPTELLAYYKDCKGSLNQCSNCLGNAERACASDLKKQGKDESICYHCTTQSSLRCGSAATMCFGDQECGGSDYQCINHSCTYVSPSK